LSWAPIAPLWTSGEGLLHPRAAFALPLMMLGPAVAAVLTVVWLRPERDRLRGLGLRLRRPGARWVPIYLFAWLGVPLLVALTPFVAALLGQYTLDLTAFSGFREQLIRAGAWRQVEQIGLPTLVALQLVALPLGP